jgi:hypothetical protein
LEWSPLLGGRPLRTFAPLLTSARIAVYRPQFDARVTRVIQDMSA